MKADDYPPWGLSLFLADDPVHAEKETGGMLTSNGRIYILVGLFGQAGRLNG